ncbi:MAG: glycosyltransferase family 4 protein [Acidimicrobiales bacterium]
MTRRTVVLVCPYALSVFGGVQEQVLAMSRELDRRGYDVDLIAPDCTDRRAYDTPARIHRFGRLLSVPANGSRAPLTISPLASRQVKSLITRRQPYVVHYHEPFAPLLGWSALRAHAAPSVGTMHRSGDGPATRLTGPLLRYLARHLDVSVAVSPAAAATMGRAAGLSPDVLFNGFEMERFIEFPRTVPDEVTVLVVGRLEERKGIATAIEVLRHHNATATRPWRLVILGDGPERARLESLAAGVNCAFLGAPSDEEKRRWLRRASVVVAPSLRGESFGLVLLEAMASQVPLVASDIEGYREAAGGHAVLVAPGDALALEAGIARALERDVESLAGASSHAAAWSMRRLMDSYEQRYELARRRFEGAR